MNSVPMCAVRGLVLPALLCLSHLSLAASPRAFAGSYELTDVVKAGAEVHVTMTLTLFNPSETAVKDGVVTVLSSAPSPTRLASFTAIANLPRISAVTVSEALVVSSSEYSNWLHGHAPRLQFSVPSGDTTIISGIQAHQVTRAASVGQ